MNYGTVVHMGSHVYSIILVLLAMHVGLGLGLGFICSYWLHMCTNVVLVTVSLPCRL